MEREAVLVGIDVGTSKVCALIGEIDRDGSLTVVGKGSVPANGLRRAVVVNIDQTVRSITSSVELAERISGWEIDRAFVGVGGAHVESQNERGAVAVSGHHREVTPEDVERATEVARAVQIPSSREILHVLPRGFIVDGQEGVKDPLGMSAIRLETETHIVTASATAVRNLAKCVAAANVKIDELVANSLASAEAVLSDTEREVGVAVADIGAGTIDLALFQDGQAYKTAVLPVGGNNVTNDVAIVLRTDLRAAEDLKIQYGNCWLDDVDPRETVNVAMHGEPSPRLVSRLDTCRVIEARMRQMFELLRAEIEAAGTSMLPAGMVLTGGASQLTGAAALGREVLGMPVRVAGPTEIAGLTDGIMTPAYSTAIGLLLWGAKELSSGEISRFESAPARGIAGRAWDQVKSFFP